MGTLAAAGTSSFSFRSPTTFALVDHLSICTLAVAGIPLSIFRTQRRSLVSPIFHSHVLRQFPVPGLWSPFYILYLVFSLLYAHHLPSHCRPLTTSPYNHLSLPGPCRRSLSIVTLQFNAVLYVAFRCEVHQTCPYPSSFRHLYWYKNSLNNTLKRSHYRFIFSSGQAASKANYVRCLFQVSSSYQQHLSNALISYFFRYLPIGKLPR